MRGKLAFAPFRARNDERRIAVYAKEGFLDIDDPVGHDRRRCLAHCVGNDRSTADHRLELVDCLPQRVVRLITSSVKYESRRAASMFFASR